MSSEDTTSTTVKGDEKPTFNEKETKLLAAAMLSIKSGFPDIDMAKFQQNGEFNTLKTAQNTWGKLKKKLMELAPESDSASGEGKGASKPLTSRSRAPKKSHNTSQCTPYGPNYCPICFQTNPILRVDSKEAKGNGVSKQVSQQVAKQEDDDDAEASR